ncbi:stage II sporulation protein M [Candidatus Woesearchaeota archaeon]|nr:stage II sporulation protein M [Candidatus Woesearchaeota archaeon]
MVLESLFNPFAVKKKPWEMFLAGFIYSLVGLMLSYFVFKEAAGLLTVFLIVLATVPLLYTTITNEEELDLQLDTEIALLKEHGKVLVFLIFLFLGIMAALSISYIMLPNEVVNVVFETQQQAISSVNNNVQGKIASFDLFTRIFSNNIKVLFFCIVFSFLYGTGALFILTWNASVVATAMGNFFKVELGKAASVVGMSSISTYFGAASISFFRYMTHGVLEMVSYFVAGLAGGIISIALIKHNLKEDRVLVDALDLILLSLGILVVAGLVEVYITPVMIR